MNRTLLWDASPGEIRVGLHENGKLRALRLFRLHDDQPSPFPGSALSVRLGAKLDVRRALVHFGDSEGEISPIPQLSEGSLFDAEMIRAAIAEPGRWKRSHFRMVQPDYVAPRTFLSPMLTGLTAIVCANPIEAERARTLLGDDCPDIRIDPEAIEDAQFDLWCERGISGEFVIDGGLLTIERTRAMTMIDIDGTGDTATINRAAARAIPWLLGLYGIGGQVGIDFLHCANKAERAAIDAELADASSALGAHERTAMNGFGFVQMVLPRPGPSVFEQLCGTGLKEASVETQALMLLRAAIRSTGYGERQIMAAPPVIAQLQRWPQLMAQLVKTLGTSVTLHCDSSGSGYGHVHVSQI